MMIKKYIVHSVPEGMNRIKSELGNDIIIVSQRKVRKKGISGYFSPKEIEITVAYENDSISSKNKFAYKDSNNMEKPKKSLRTYPSVNNTKKNSSEVESQIIKDVNEMKSMISQFMNNNCNVNKTEDKFHNYKKFLMDRDITEDVIDSIIEKLKGIENLGDEVDVSLVRDTILDIVKCNESNDVVIKDGVTAFVGPTGVGKTTTIAKLAGKYSLEYKKKVGLITVDTYRIGAIEQLKTYAEIMGIPFEVVFNIKEMETAIENMKECDMIFLDTTGRSSKNLMQLQELRAFVKKAEPNMVFLVLSATTKGRDIDSIIEGYKVMDYQSLIVTKLDETTTYGSILTMIKNSKVPVSYITVGQGVPQDIKKIIHKELVEIVLGETSIC